MKKLIVIVLILLLSPFLLLIGLLIYIEDGKPILFKQVRVGKEEQEFVFYKFRTMHKETPNVPTNEFNNAKTYILKVGQLIRLTSLDELPNLFNVFKGDMNFVGPRPSQPNENPLNEMRRAQGAFKVKPGITGLAQVNGRDHISLEKKVTFDAAYAKNHNFWMDLKIVLITFFKIINFKDIKH